MHAARLYESPRLQRVANLLLRGDWFSTMHIAKKANVCAVNSIISELRANQWVVDCRVRSTQNGKVWQYKASDFPKKHRVWLQKKLKSR